MIRVSSDYGVGNGCILALTSSGSGRYIYIYFFLSLPTNFTPTPALLYSAFQRSLH